MLRKNKNRKTIGNFVKADPLQSARPATYVMDTLVIEGVSETGNEYIPFNLSGHLKVGQSERRHKIKRKKTEIKGTDRKINGT